MLNQRQVFNCYPMFAPGLSFYDINGGVSSQLLNVSYPVLDLNRAIFLLHLLLVDNISADK